MTKEEYVAETIANIRKSFPDNPVTPADGGFVFCGIEEIALPCYCQAPSCRGWLMVVNTAEHIDQHKRIAGRP